jgi:hypothetical protein
MCSNEATESASRSDTRSRALPRTAPVITIFWPLDTMPPLRVLAPAPSASASSTTVSVPFLASSAAADSPL